MTRFIRASGLKADDEVSVRGRERPADIFLERWTGVDPVAVDVTVTHPLAPSLGLSASAARLALAGKERQKLRKYAHLVEANQLSLVPFPMSTFGQLSTQASTFVDEAASFYSARQDIVTVSATAAPSDRNIPRSGDASGRECWGWRRR